MPKRESYIDSLNQIMNWFSTTVECIDTTENELIQTQGRPLTENLCGDEQCACLQIDIYF